LDEDHDFQEFAGAFLKASSTGVDRLTVHKEELSREELRSLLPANFVSRLLKDVDEDGTSLVRLDEGHELLAERKNGQDDRFYRFSVQAVHEQQSGKGVSLDLEDESDGTRRLLNLLPALYRLRNKEAAYFIDEIDRSLHPILVREFLHLFLKSCNIGLRQILVTTHESNLLDLALLRRDEIWFVEKDDHAATRLYSLLDFKVRNDLEVRKHYLQGRFGAIPFLGSLNDLIGYVNLPQ
jgi:AAA15 family ATPase/GTPase